MATRETALPGVGTKYAFELSKGGELVIVQHRVGNWELARVGEDGATTTLLNLQPKEAGEVARILSGREEPTEEARRQLLFQEFCMEWVTLEEGSPLVGQTLRDSGIRASTGASVIAISRTDASIPSPPPETRFCAGDTLIVIGQRDQIDAFIRAYSSLDLER